MGRSAFHAAALATFAAIALPSCGSGIPLPGGYNSATVFSYYLIAVDGADGLIRSYSIDSSSGALTATGPAIASGGAYVAAASPDGRFAFAAGGHSISSFTLDAASGRLAPVNTITIASSNPCGIFAHPSGKFVFVTDGTPAPNGHVYTFAVDPSTGAISQAAATSAGGADYPMGVFGTPDGAFLFAADYAVGLGSGDKVSAYSIDPVAGALAAVGGSPFAATNANQHDPRNLAVDAAGKHLYAADESSNPVKVSWFNIGANGALAVQGSASASAGGVGAGLAISPDGGLVFDAVRGNNTVAAFTVAPVTGALAFKSSTSVPNNMPVSVAVHPIARFIYVAGQGAPATISAFSYDANGALASLSPATYALAPGGSSTANDVAIARVASH